MRSLELSALLVVAVCGVVAAAPGFLLTGPKIVQLDSVETYCVSVVEMPGPANCTLQLLEYGMSQVVATTHHHMKGPKECVKVHVPRETDLSGDASKFILRLRLDFDADTDYKVDAATEVHFRRPSPILLVQTDKAWYTPGQLVRFRALSLDHLLRPLVKPVSQITVKDPLMTVIAQWTNLTAETTHGLHQLELQLSAEPVQGLWRIVMDVDKQRHTQEFEVREFVLPKFEATLKTPGFLSYNRRNDQTVQKVIINVCAKYSYGQPVRGTWSATIQVTTSNWRYNNEWWDSDRDVGAIVKTMERKGTLDAATGCSQLKVAGDGLGLHLGADDDDDRNVRVTAVVTEAGTGLQANATWSVDVQRHRLQVKVRTRGHETFKNGLPYYGSLQVSHGDGTPAAGVEVRVCAKPTHLPATSPAPVPYQKPLVGSIIQDIESQILPNQSLEPKDEELVDIIQDPEPPEPEPEPEPLEPEPLEPEPLEPEPLEPEPLEPEPLEPEPLEPEPLEPEPLEPEPEPELEPGPEPEPEPEPESEWDQEKPVGTLIESKVEVLQEVEEELFVAVHVRRPEPPLPPPRAPPAPEYCAVRQSDAHGMARFELLPNEADIIEYDIKATVLGNDKETVETQTKIFGSFSPSDSFLIFAPPADYPRPASCGSVLPLKLYFTADKEVNFDLHYIVMARGDVISSGINQVKFREEDNVDLGLGDSLLNRRPAASGDDAEGEWTSRTVGDIEIELKVSPEMVPEVSLLAYYVRDDKEVVTASIVIPVTNCFPNPVNLTWSSSRRQPGQQVALQMRAEPGSLCGYSVVDRSVTYVRPDLQLKESDVYDRLPDMTIDPAAAPIQATPEWEYCNGKRRKYKATELLRTFGSTSYRQKRSFYGGWSNNYSPFKDAIQAFDDAGLLVISDLTIETRRCLERTDYMMMRKGGVDYEVYEAVHYEDVVMAVPLVMMAYEQNEDYEKVADLSSTVSVRTYFPETWLWDLATLDSRGEATETVELPHTVTTWVGRAVCVSESAGFGMSAPANIEAFQPFFLELHLPYATKRGETLQIKVSVFNYADVDLPVRLTLAYSEELELLGDSDSAPLCLPARDNVVHQFLVHAVELGRHNVTVSAVIDDQYPGACGPEFLPYAKDTVVKELLVQPEGFPVERVYSHLACPQDFEEDKGLNWNLTLPEDLVEGSARAWITAVGDLMGPALQGLSGLVQMPMGCGEQNMILFTPNIYVVQYLESTGQLQPAIQRTAISYMKSGYQRELKYRHDDYSYSAFGKSDDSGSLWLTAFVVRSFSAARRYIEIDPSDLDKSAHWLLSKQLENGCFPIVGTVLHKELKGGGASASDKNLAPLSAYVLVALLEAYYGDSVESTNEAQNLLNSTLPCLEPEESDQPDLYTTALTVYALTLANRIREARSKLAWLMERSYSGPSLLWWEKPGSGDAFNVELTSYVLLSLVRLGASEDLVAGRSIVRWLSKQRNSEGGFHSTQDTVVALQAIAAYAARIGAQPVNMKMLLTAGDFEREIRVEQADRLVQRRVDLPLPLASSASLDSVGEGNGCAVVQATLRYNVHTPPANSAFDFTNVTSKPLVDGVECGHRRLTLCVRYQLNEVSNMALVEIGLVSGYEPVRSSLDRLLADPSNDVKRHEIKGDVVVIYFDQIKSAGDTCVDVDVRPAFEVNDVKEAGIKIYDYYQPEHTVSVSYHMPSGCLGAAAPPPPPPEPPVSVDPAPLPPPPPPPPTVVEPEPDGRSAKTEDYSEYPPEPKALPVLVLPPLPEIILEEPIEDELEQQEQQMMIEPPVQVVQHRTVQRHVADDSWDEFADFDTDLQVPDGLEGPQEVFTTAETQRGCPQCLAEPPVDLAALYCRSRSVVWVEVRPARGQRLRLLYDVSPQHNGRQVKLKSSVELQLEPQCSCPVLASKNRNVTVVGLPTRPLPVPPKKLQVGAELWIIERNPSQLGLKRIRGQCDALNDVGDGDRLP